MNKKIIYKMIDEKEAKEEELRKQKERERIAFLSCKTNN
jgi:hypothetical protein